MSSIGKEVLSQVADKWLNEVTGETQKDPLPFKPVRLLPLSKSLSPKGLIYRRNIEETLNYPPKPRL